MQLSVSLRVIFFLADFNDTGSRQTLALGVILDCLWLFFFFFLSLLSDFQIAAIIAQELLLKGQDPWAVLREFTGQPAN